MGQLLRSASLRNKLMVFGLTLTIAPLLITGAVVYAQNKSMEQAAAEECAKLAAQDLDHIVKSVYALCETQQEVLQATVDSSLNVAGRVLDEAGGVRFSSETVSWSAVNQTNKKAITVDLPRMHAGQEWFGQTRSMSENVPVVDDVARLVDATCTVFQRMNDRGDMLRVATNVEKADGNRAIGTYIPHTSPVVQTVLSGKTFSGRAFVVDRWYITAYEPLRDDTGDVVGVLYVGIPQEKATALREAIMDYVVGETGYVFVLNATGRTKGHYVISQDGERDGDDIWDASDADGRFFIQEMCETAIGLSEGEATDFVYPWKSDGETEARNKIARVMYFEPWDWVIGASCYTCEYNRAKQRVAALGTQSMFILGGLVVGAAVLAFLFWYGLSGGLSKTIGEAVAQLTGASDQVEMASQQVAESSQQLAAGASQQAASVEEASSSLEELTSMTRSNLENASQASERATQSRDAAHRGREAMERMTETIGRIKTSADETAQILRTIDEIAFQTNLLALNAAVEAARAGDAGKGFAVVAEEVRNLALRSAEAASRTGQLIEDSQKNADNGVNVTKEMSEALGAIVGNIDEVTQLAQSVTQATEEQTRGIDQINKAVAEVDKVTQISAATSEESASASEELSSQAVELRSLVEELDRVVQGARAGNGQHLLEAPVNRPQLTGPDSRAVFKR